MTHDPRHADTSATGRLRAHKRDRQAERGNLTHDARHGGGIPEGSLADALFVTAV